MRYLVSGLHLLGSVPACGFPVAKIQYEPHHGCVVGGGGVYEESVPSYLQGAIHSRYCTKLDTAARNEPTRRHRLSDARNISSPTRRNSTLLRGPLRSIQVLVDRYEHGLP